VTNQMCGWWKVHVLKTCSSLRVTERVLRSQRWASGEGRMRVFRKVWGLEEESRLPQSYPRRPDSSKLGDCGLNLPNNFHSTPPIGCNICIVYTPPRRTCVERTANPRPEAELAELCKSERTVRSVACFDQRRVLFATKDQMSIFALISNCEALLPLRYVLFGINVWLIESRICVVEDKAAELQYVRTLPFLVNKKCSVFIA